MSPHVQVKLPAHSCSCEAASALRVSLGFQCVPQMSRSRSRSSSLNALMEQRSLGAPGARPPPVSGGPASSGFTSQGRELIQFMSKQLLFLFLIYQSIKNKRKMSLKGHRRDIFLNVKARLSVSLLLLFFH